MSYLQEILTTAISKFKYLFRCLTFGVIMAVSIKILWDTGALFCYIFELLYFLMVAFRRIHWKEKIIYETWFNALELFAYALTLNYSFSLIKLVHPLDPTPFEGSKGGLQIAGAVLFCSTIIGIYKVFQRTNWIFPQVYIKTATYGANGILVDVLLNVERWILDNDPVIINNDSIFRNGFDPIPNFSKALSVKYIRRGKMYIKTFQENETFALP